MSDIFNTRLVSDWTFTVSCTVSQIYPDRSLLHCQMLKKLHFINSIRSRRESLKDEPETKKWPSFGSTECFLNILCSRSHSSQKIHTHRSSSRHRYTSVSPACSYFSPNQTTHTATAFIGYHRCLHPREMQNPEGKQGKVNRCKHSYRLESQRPSEAVRFQFTLCHFSTSYLLNPV